MADEKKKRKTGLGVDAFFPAVEEVEEEKPSEPEKFTPPKSRRTRATKSKAEQDKRTPTKKPPAKTTEEEKEEALPRRRTAWLREDHLDRLETLKRRERSRLRSDPDKRVAVTTLIDEAIERYLADMEK